ncbi:hypothetical protein BOTBODRAFT_150898 [Botryobasidium botryosum FD-172 SS1]|uniref:CCR4-Not complex 3'-5'-exoribonuclease subunit Ccr4 n=1 Tax=Botryobasidium botryosum (strain FD-172 SS1) TaxID=930990 RepID=A0A067NDP7_BOTB1|nr:hypothetical protein BOTBODRAFT_150898 [Botryobasidium botryosum FD-172 SS1]
MYYNAPPPSSPIHLQHDHPWNRQHHPVLNGQQPPPPGGVQPQSPGYGLVQYTNGVHHHPHHHPSLTSIAHPAYSSPSNQHAQAHRQTSSPSSTNPLIGTVHWQKQMLKAELCRQSSSPHHRARASALASRNTTKSAITITDPNRPPVSIKPAPETPTRNGHKKNLSVSDRTDDSSSTDDDSSATSHPSATVAPVAIPPPVSVPVSTPSAPRPSQPRKSDSPWSTLDMGGMRLKNLSSAVFDLHYLTTLYINHNQLQTLSPLISQLRHLVLLDLSGNMLATIPPELGMCTSLKELFLFDNLIETLPPELGSLHQLEMLGIEGNPIQPSLRAIIQKDGTAALISYLRDSCPVPAPPPERQWRPLLSEVERQRLDTDPSVERFSLLCYNILCERSATSQMYGYTPSWALSWDYRKELILTEIMTYDSDFLCLQEVDVAQYEDYFLPSLSPHGYEGVYWPKTRARTMGESERRRVDGCATFFKSSKYQLVEQQLIEFNQVALQRPDFKKTDDMFNRVLTKDHIAVVVLLENKETGSRLIVANAHMYWNAEYRDVKLVQTALLMDELAKISDRFSRLPPRLLNADGKSDQPQAPAPTYENGTKIPMIVCGDFNSMPDSGVYEFLSRGNVPSGHPDFMSHVYGNYTSDGLKHNMGLRSSYAGIGELPMTNYTPSFEGVIDYIFYSASNLSVSAVLGEVDAGYLSKVVGFPNVHFPSDHICIASEFRLKHPPKDAPAQPQRPAPVFPNSSRQK